MREVGRNRSTLRRYWRLIRPTAHTLPAWGHCTTRRFHGLYLAGHPARAARDQRWAHVQELSLGPAWRLGRPKYLGAGDQIRSIVPAGPPPATEPLWSGVASSGNRSRKLPCLRKKDGVRRVRSIAQYGGRRLGKGQDTGGPLETAGSAGD